MAEDYLLKLERCEQLRHRGAQKDGSDEQTPRESHELHDSLLCSRADAAPRLIQLLNSDLERAQGVLSESIVALFPAGQSQVDGQVCKLSVCPRDPGLVRPLRRHLVIHRYGPPSHWTVPPSPRTSPASGETHPARPAPPDRSSSGSRRPRLLPPRMPRDRPETHGGSRLGRRSRGFPCGSWGGQH